MTAVDDETVTEVVREAVAEHERTYHDVDDDATADDGETDEPSASDRSPVGLLGGAAVLALLGYLARKRLRDADDEHRQENHGRDRDATDAGEPAAATDR